MPERAREAKLKKEAWICWIIATLVFLSLVIGAGTAMLDDWGFGEKLRQPAGNPPTYVVKAEETWKDVAKRFDVEVNRLKEENPDKEISDGITLTIPSSAEVYTIESKDTLKKIADGKGVSLARLRNQNEDYIKKAIEQEDAQGNKGFPLVVGDEIVIPPQDPVKDRIPSYSVLFAACLLSQSG
jgi:LysM repeat protein